MGPQQLTFELVVNDGFGTSEAAATTVTVNPVLEVPYAPTNVVAVTRQRDGDGDVHAGPRRRKPIIVYVASCASSNGGVAEDGLRRSADRRTFTGLTNGEVYTCTVRGVNAIGAGPSRRRRRSSVPAAPPAHADERGGRDRATVRRSCRSRRAPTAASRTCIYVVACTSTNGGAAGGVLFGSEPGDRCRASPTARRTRARCSPLHALGCVGALGPVAELRGRCPGARRRRRPR